MSKSLAVAQYILDKTREIHDDALTPMQLIKLVYVAHGYMLAEHGEPLLNESVEAWQYGPVVRSVYEAVRDFRSSPVEYVPGARRWSGPFDLEEKAIMEQVAEMYGDVNGVRLSAATHKPGTPWSITWDRHGRNAEISNDLIEDFYQRILAQPRHSSL
ncbi:Panacea domain-containing protein [Pseudomonas coronafaciens]|uniref:Panacea domain-containing protein n=1 Tax=Pseudomonas coronafaciens TaxID=53409 RepID=UPI000F000DCF|nr:type II toxin-antitoxin system antitoxin SocA domain-containing protein [Pseudomonas coronafaciens]